MGQTSIDELPQLAALIGRIAVHWSWVDVHLALLLGSLLGVESRASVAVFTALKQHRTQRDALKAAASGTLKDDLLDLFKALMSVHEQLDKQRNSVVHSVWGRAESAPDGIIWSSIETHALALMQEYHLEKSGSVEGRAERLVEECFVVKLEDLETLTQEIMQLAKAALSFHVHLRYCGEPAGDYALKALLRDPAIKLALQKVRESQR